jgi:hypothetical protein
MSSRLTGPQKPKKIEGIRASRSTDVEGEIEEWNRK